MENITKTIPRSPDRKYTALRVVQYDYEGRYFLEEFNGGILALLSKDERLLNAGRFEMFQEEPCKHEVTIVLEFVLGMQRNIETYLDTIAEIVTRHWSLKKHCRVDNSTYVFSFESERDALLFRLRTV